MKRIPISAKLKHFGQLFTEAGFNCYLVGGAVRNIIAGHPPSDYDFTTDAKPEEVMKIFRRVITTGIEHGTVTVLFRGEAYEVTTFRIEKGYSDSRRPDEVLFTSNIFEDLSRRDFTINAIAADLIDGTIIDPIEGQKDIQNRVLKCIGDPFERFNEDGLRILRLFRFHAKMGFTIDSASLEAAAQLREKLQKISAERIRVELVKTVLSPRPSETFRLMLKCGVLEQFLPELALCADVEQNQYHSWDVFEHCIRSCEAAPEENLTVRLAALFHDIGKPEAKFIKDGQAAFHNHENIGAKITEKLMKRLKFSRKEIQETTHLIRQHMFHYTSDWSDKAVRRFMARVGVDKLPQLMSLRKADQGAHHGEEKSDTDLSELLGRIEKVIQNGEALSIKDLQIDGNDLIKAGVEKGRIIGVILEELLDVVMQDPTQNNKEQLLRIALGIIEPPRKN